MDKKSSNWESIVYFIFMIGGFLLVAADIYGLLTAWGVILIVVGAIKMERMRNGNE